MTTLAVGRTITFAWDYDDLTTTNPDRPVNFNMKEWVQGAWVVVGTVPFPTLTMVVTDVSEGMHVYAVEAINSSSLTAMSEPLILMPFQDFPEGSTVYEKRITLIGKDTETLAFSDVLAMQAFTLDTRRFWRFNINKQESTVTVQTSTDLMTWTDIGTVHVENLGATLDNYKLRIE